MINGEKVLDHPIRWAMVGGGRGSQIGYIHRSAALRDRSFELVAGAFDINPERGKDFGIQARRQSGPLLSGLQDDARRGGKAR